MKLLALLLLVALPAWADDAPRRLNAFPVSAGYLVTEPAWVYTEEGKAKVDAELSRLYQKSAADDAEKASLKASLLEMEQKPALTGKGALLLLGVGLAVGVASAFLVVALRR